MLAPSLAVKPSKAKAGDKGGSGGQAYVDNVIRRSITSGPLTRDTLRKEFTSVAEQLYADSVEGARGHMGCCFCSWDTARTRRAACDSARHSAKPRE